MYPISRPFSLLTILASKYCPTRLMEKLLRCIQIRSRGDVNIQYQASASHSTNYEQVPFIAMTGDLTDLESGF